VTLLDDVAVDTRGNALRLADDGVVATSIGNDAPHAWSNVERVLRTAGSRAARRDAVDTRIVQSVIDGTGRIIDDENQVGGYPDRKATTRTVEVPASGRAEWLQKLSDDLSVDRTIDVRPLWKRLNVRAR